MPCGPPSAALANLRGDQFALFGGALENRAGHGRADHGRVEHGLGVIRLPLRLLQGAPGAGDFLLPRTNPGQLESLVQRIYALLVSLELGGGVIERLLREHAFGWPGPRVRSRVSLSSARVARASSRLCWAC